MKTTIFVFLFAFAQLKCASDQQQAQRQVPLRRTHVIDTGTQLQHVVPVVTSSNKIACRTWDKH